jgi:hypothetical protein
MATRAPLQESLAALVYILFGVGLGYLAVWDTIQDIRYLRYGRSTTAQAVKYHSGFRSASRYDVIYEREGQQVHARMYVHAFFPPHAGDQILYLPDGTDKVIRKSAWSHLCAFVGDAFIVVIALAAVMGGLVSLFDEGKTDQKDGASAPGAPSGTDKAPAGD